MIDEKKLKIDEAIAHAREVAEENYKQGFLCHANPNDDELDGCIKCAKEHEQLAEWLEELKQYRAVGTVEQFREAVKNKWITCSVALPQQPEENPIFDNKPLELYLVSVKNDDYPIRALWNGKFFTDGWSKVDVIAWQPLPHPFQKG